MNETVLAFGGVDIVVNNAGITLAAAVEDTTLELWNKNMAILGTGYFLVGREGYPPAEAPEAGGSMIFICLEERRGGIARRLGLLCGQGGGDPSGPLHGAGGRAAWHPRQCGEPRCGAARLEDLAGRMAPAARRLAQDHRG
jgi:hypothetical protein